MNSDNSQYKVEQNLFEKSIIVPTSKSYANRVLILAAIDKKPTMITGLPKSSDVLKMVDCMKKIGLNIEEIKNGIIIKNSFPECELSKSDALTLKTGDGGTTNRFIIPLLARGKRTYHIAPEGHMWKRPMDDLIKPMKSLGVDIDYSEKDNVWITLTGNMKEGKNITVDCTRSTQFATGLFLATVDKNINIELSNFTVSKKYFEMTQSLIEEYKSNKQEYNVPPDFSGLSYPAALGLMCGNVTIENCFERDFYQADSILLEIIEEIGGVLSWTKRGLSIRKADSLSPIIIDGSTCPDLIPTLAFISSYIKGKSIFSNLEVLRHKECDRIEEVLNILKLFEVKHSFKSDSHTLIIEGSDNKTKFKEYTPPWDHRMVMTSYLFMRRNSGGSIKNFRAVAKSFPSFFDVMS